MSFPALDPATGCRNAGPGATNMLYWLDRESQWAGTVYNLGICNCRMIAGKATRSSHGECRAWDAGLPMVNGRANPIGHQIIRALLPKVGSLGIQCLIFDRTIWSASSPQGKRYTGVSPHYDHIHGEHTRRAAAALNVPTVRSVMGGVVLPPPPVTNTPTLPPQSEEDDEMPKLIRCNEKAHPQFGAVWAISGLTRTPVTAADYERWRFFAGAPAECDGGTFDYFMRTTQDISNWGAVALTVLYVRTVVDRIATKLGVPK